ncbi:hypothetical protein, partial [Salmonella sp. SAL4458]|uniref:hypothetical protein n=1 Tax=Salmonella sp. SAL4458 TaxID=3159913 RepID=UPI00397A4A02
ALGLGTEHLHDAARQHADSSGYQERTGSTGEERRESTHDNQGSPQNRLEKPRLLAPDHQRHDADILASAHVQLLAGQVGTPT